MKDTSVYVVLGRCSYSRWEEEILGVFSTSEKAEEYCNLNGTGYVEEYLLDGETKE